MKSFFLSLIFLIGSCQSSQQKIILHDEVDSDAEYNPVYREHTRQNNVYRDFESIYIVHATYLSKDFQLAFKKRFNALHASDEDSFELEPNQFGFFVSIFVPETNMSDLRDKKLWKIYINIAGARLEPSLVRPLRQKHQWSPFFPYINKWSQEYLIVFDSFQQAVSGSSHDLSSKVMMSITNLDARVDLTW